MDETRVPLAQLFGAVAQTMQERQDYLNQIDGSDGDAGDNAAYNWQLVAQVAAEAEAANPDAGYVLASAAQALKQGGRGKTAAVYARGLDSAASQFQGQQGMTLSDFQPLVESMTSGMQTTGRRKKPVASPADAFASAVQGFSQAREQGLDDQQVAMAGLARSAQGGGGDLMGALLPMIVGGLLSSGMGGRPSGNVGQPADPMGGLLGGLLGSMLGGGGAAPQAPQGGGPDLGSLLGGLLGGQAPQPSAPESQQAPDLGSILGGLLGGQAPQPSQPNPDDVLLGGLSEGNIPTLPSSSPPAPSSDDPVVLGGLSGDAPQSGGDEVLLGGLSGGAEPPPAPAGQPDLGSLLGALLGGQGVAPQAPAGPPPDAGPATGTILLEGLLRGLSGGGGR